MRDFLKQLVVISVIICVCINITTSSADAKEVPNQDFQELVSRCILFSNEVEMPTSKTLKETEKTLSSRKKELQDKKKTLSVAKEFCQNRMYPLLIDLQNQIEKDEKEISHYEKIEKRRQERAKELKQKQKHQQQEKKKKTLSNKYPEAYQVWAFLKDRGYNDYVSAGILGNMMVEVGGQTFNLQTQIYDYTNSYYGICQWDTGIYNIAGANLQEQLDLLTKTIEEEFNTFGFVYMEEFNYRDFLELTSSRDAALAFAQCYERCDSAYYSIRQDCAEIAYETFASL